MKPAKLAQVLSLIFVAGAAWAQQDVQRGERIEITGSSIKRVQDEGALPVQTITRQDIERRGFVSAEQLLMSISANGTTRPAAITGSEPGTSENHSRGPMNATGTASVWPYSW